MKLKSMVGGLAALGLVMTAGVASAETWQTRTFNDLVSDASICIKGEVVRVTNHMQDGQAYTIALLEVAESAFGPNSRFVTLRLEGGPISTASIPVVETASHGITLFSGEEYIIMGQNARQRGRLFVPLNGGQGVMHVRNGKVNLPIGDGSAMDAGAAIDIIADLRAQNAKNVAQ